VDRIDFPLLGNSIIMAVVILVHVFIAFFAVGGSVLAVFAEWWGTKKKDNDYIRLARSVSGFLSDMMKINGVLGVAIVVHHRPVDSVRCFSFLNPFLGFSG